MTKLFTDKEMTVDIDDVVKGAARWAHAINSRSNLEMALSMKVDYIEVDVTLSSDGLPIAAHPPANDSDLSISYLLKRLRQTSIGLKLDFKITATVMPVLLELASMPLSQQVFLNADVLSAHGADVPTINGEWFIKVCSLYPKGVLSLGWCTNALPECKYSEQNISDMLTLTETLDVVTFPIRASLLPASWSDIRRLLTLPNRSLTLWDSRPLESELKSWIRLNTDPQLCYYDIDLSL